MARGIYIARLDDDDYWCDTEKLAKQVAFLNAHLDCVVAGGGTIVIDENDKERFRYLNWKPIRRFAVRRSSPTHSPIPR